MTQDDVIEMARQVGVGATGNEYWPFFIEELEAFAHLVAAKATEETNARANAWWELMCKKMIAFEREGIIHIIKETPFSNWFQADLIAAIRARGDQV